MEKNTLKAITVIAIVIGAFGLTFGYLAVARPETMDPILLFSAIPAPKGGNGVPGDPVVGILDPDYGETYSGNITIRAMVWSASAYTISVLRNGIEIGTSVPLEWNTTTELDGLYNITVAATDSLNNVGKDEIWIIVNNTPDTTSQGGNVFIRWGNDTAPEGSTLLYSGIGFARYWGHDGGPSDPIVLKYNYSGNTTSDNAVLYPLKTQGNIPPGITINCYVVAAVCYVTGPTFIIWGSWTPPSGWRVLYKGFAMGSRYIETSINPICVECEYFNSSLTNTTTNVALLYGLEVNNPPPGGYPMDRFIQCAVVTLDS
ncbi:MAG: hypothetical protein HWN67_08615 [Candidatus Helarchaeota archaeon]|nr:hypothetical protein [Candidatus Helarchaeota archaeon]